MRRVKEAPALADGDCQWFDLAARPVAPAGHAFAAFGNHPLPSDAVL